MLWIQEEFVKMQRKHYHLMAGSGNIVEHVHSRPGHRHEHDGMRMYAISRNVIERAQKYYRANRKSYFAGLAKLTST